MPNTTGLYVCPDCQRTFTRSEVLAQHIAQPHTLACQQCAFKTTRVKFLKPHERAHRTDVGRCDKCDFQVGS